MAPWRLPSWSMRSGDTSVQGELRCWRPGFIDPSPHPSYTPSKSTRALGTHGPWKAPSRSQGPVTVTLSSAMRQPPEVYVFLKVSVVVVLVALNTTLRVVHADEPTEKLYVVPWYEMSV